MTQEPKPRKPWWQQKTTWAGGFTCVGAVTAFLAGEMGAFEAIQMLGTGLIAIFLRQAVNEQSPASSPPKSPPKKTQE